MHAFPDPARVRHLPAHGRRPLVAWSPIAVAAGVLLALAISVPALAHAELVSSDPPDGAVLADTPAAIVLTFSEDLDPAKSSFKMSGPSGTVGNGKVGSVATQMLLTTGPLPPGSYTIQWTSMSTDQHLLRGTLTFTVAAATAPPATSSPVPPASAEPSAAPSIAASAPAPSPAPSVAPAASAAANDTVQAASGDVILPIVAALVLVAGVGVYLLRRSRRS
jgi:methionine-rich copper-binding protein CopC